MAGEIPTLVLTVDLGCHLCFKKIKKVLCKLQDRECIHSTTYDVMNGKVRISGPFDPIKLEKKLRCKACKVIKGITIGGENNEPDKPKSPEPEKKKLELLVNLPFWPAGLVGPTMPACCCRPCYVPYCCSCGWMAARPPPLPAVGKPVTYQFSCDYEEVPPLCKIM